MGERGPIPKRTEEKRRMDNAGNEPERVQIREGTVEPPKGDPKWLPVASQWYESLKESGQSRYYEPSDWAQAHIIAGMIHEGFSLGWGVQNGQGSGLQPSTIFSAMNDLMANEGSRRRMRLELVRKGPAKKDKAEVAAEGDVADILRLA